MPDDAFTALPFDQYQRYRVVQRAIGHLRGAREGPLRVLDVGGHAFGADGSRSVLPIRLCLPQDDTVVLDTQDCDAPGYLRGNGAAIPFADDSFDVVVSCDAFEHVPPCDRSTFLHEISRVSRDYVILIAPFHQPVTRLAEEILEQFIFKTLRVVHPALREHLAQGLPAREEVQDLLERAGVSFVDFPSGHVYHWLTIMLAKHYLLSIPGSSEMNERIDAFYNEHFANGDERPPGYRHIFIVSKAGHQEALRGVLREHEELAGVNPRGASGDGLALFELLMTFLQLKRETGADGILQEQLLARERHIIYLEKLLAERAADVDQLKKRLMDYHEKLDDYREQLAASLARLEASEAALGQTRDLVERIKRGKVLSTMLRVQGLLSRF